MLFSEPRSVRSVAVVQTPVTSSYDGDVEQFRDRLRLYKYRTHTGELSTLLLLSLSNILVLRLLDYTTSVGNYSFMNPKGSTSA